MITTSLSDGCATVGAEALPQMPVTMDGKGRVRTTREQRQLILAEFERSRGFRRPVCPARGLEVFDLGGLAATVSAVQTRGPRPAGEDAGGRRRSRPRRAPAVVVDFAFAGRGANGRR